MEERGSRITVRVMYCEAKGHSQLLESRKGRKTDSPLETPVTNAAVPTMISAQWDPFQSSDLQNCNVTNFCCFKPLSL